MTADTPPGAQILERLSQAGVIPALEYDAVIHRARQADGHIADAIIELGLASEGEVLRTMAEIARTQFVSTDKLQRVRVTRTLIEMVPRKLAERVGVFPIVFDRKTQMLSVVTYDLQTMIVQDHVHAATDARKVTPYVARPAAVKAAIRRYYYGEADAFKRIGGGGRSRRPGGGSEMGFALQSDPGIGIDIGLEPEPAPRRAPRRQQRPARPERAAPQARPAARPQPKPSPAAPMIELDASLSAALSGKPVPPPAESAPAQPAPAAAPAPAQPAPVEAAPRRGAIHVSPRTYLETLNVLMTLMEQDRGELRGHTSLVARLSRKVCDVLDIPKDQTFDIVTAAYLHDVGKTGSYHLTPLNVARYEGHKLQAQKSHQSPLRLFDSAALPERVQKTLTHLYERYDGQGFPERLSGKEIPLGSRILAMVETYADITATTKNPFRRKLNAREACDALDGLKGEVFDPALCDVMRRIAVGDEVRNRLLDDARAVLVVDPDVESTTVLEMRLMEHGHRVHIARGFDQALDILAESEVDLIVSEVELPKRDGFKFIERCRAGSQPDTPFVFLTRRGDRESVARGFELGAADYVVKPASPEVVAMKVGQVLSQARAKTKARGVSGSLSEMGLPDVIQVLSNGRKSGRLELRSGSDAGEIHFGSGAICDARFGSLSGAEAVYAMLGLTDGEFSLDPSFEPGENVINQPSESLLLEGMRRMDEAGR